MASFGMVVLTLVGLAIAGFGGFLLLDWIDENKKEWNGNVVFHVVAFGIAIVLGGIALLIAD